MLRARKTRSVGRRTSRAVRLVACTWLAAVGLSGLVLGATALPAAAATTTVTKTTTLSGTRVVSSTRITFSGFASGYATFTETVKWTQPANLNTTYDPNTVRQGQSPSPTVSYSTASAGTMTVTWKVFWTITVATLASFSGTKTITASGPCSLKASGPTYTCKLVTPKVTLITIVIGHLKVYLGATVTITPTGLTTTRRAVLGGVTVGTAPLVVTETPTSDLLAVPCTTPAGTSLTYTLTALSTTDAIHIANKLFFTVTILGIGTTPTVTLGTQTSTITMTGAGATFSFGNVLANNIPPVANAGGPYSGNEGSPIQFTGSGSSSFCGIPTLEWQFSDGGVAYGVSPQHTFEGPGKYSGLLTATDSSGLTNTATFTVAVADLPAVVDAGPAITTEWGVPVTLNGSAVDPGTNQQPLLTYAWTFNDGTGGSGGASVTHTYATPGTYRPTLAVCDPQGVCGFGATTVTVTKRGTVLSYTGATAGNVTDASTFQASLIDDTGHAVNGATVQFFLNGSPVAGATTDASGTASVAYPFPLGTVGTSSVVAKFAGTGKYTASQSAATTFIVAKDPTSLTYTGVTSVKNAHTAAFSATLTDDAGRALAGKTVSFKLGAQGCTGTTSTLGVASCSIAKVTEKSGKYVLSVAFAGTGSYVGASEGIGFTVGS